jgi:hypothetical protein
MTFLATASGLMMESVRSMAMEKLRKINNQQSPLF